MHFLSFRGVALEPREHVNRYALVYSVSISLCDLPWNRFWRRPRAFVNGTFKVFPKRVNCWVSGGQKESYVLELCSCFVCGPFRTASWDC